MAVPQQGKHKEADRARKSNDSRHKDSHADANHKKHKKEKKRLGHKKHRQQSGSRRPSIETAAQQGKRLSFSRLVAEMKQEIQKDGGQAILNYEDEFDWDAAQRQAEHAQLLQLLIDASESNDAAKLKSAIAAAR